MKALIQKPYFIFFGLAIAMLISSFFKKDIEMDINIFYIYVEIKLKNIELISFAYFMLISLNYFLLNWINRKPIYWLTIFHILFQIVALILLYNINTWSWIEEIKNINGEIIKINEVNYIPIISILTFIFSFFIHFLNFIISIFLKRE